MVFAVRLHLGARGRAGLLLQRGGQEPVPVVWEEGDVQPAGQSTEGEATATAGRVVGQAAGALTDFFRRVESDASVCIGRQGLQSAPGVQETGRCFTNIEQWLTKRLIPLGCPRLWDLFRGGNTYAALTERLGCWRAIRERKVQTTRIEKHRILGARHGTSLQSRVKDCESQTEEMRSMGRLAGRPPRQL